MIVYLSTEDLLALVDDLGVGSVRDLGLLESAARRPATTLWGTPAYASLDEQAAALLESIVRSPRSPTATSGSAGSRWSCSSA